MSLFKRDERGAASELRAAAWLLDQGYEVFRNVCPVGRVDMIARDSKSNEIILIDVKSSVKRKYYRKSDNKISYYWNPAITSDLARDAEKNNIKFLYVFEDGEVSWKQRSNIIGVDE